MSHYKIGDPVPCEVCKEYGWVDTKAGKRVRCPGCGGAKEYAYRPACRGNEDCLVLACCDRCLRCFIHCGCPNGPE